MRESMSGEDRAILTGIIGVCTCVLIGVLGVQIMSGYMTNQVQTTQNQTQDTAKECIKDGGSWVVAAPAPGGDANAINYECKR